MKKNYTDKTIVLTDILDDRKFIIPSFQRNVVWKKARRKEFLRNVRDGEPFGIILIRENNGRYELIDGLQRISTIKDYINNKFDYLEPKDINIESVKKIVVAHLESLGLPVTDDYLSQESEEYREVLFDCIKGGLENYEIMTSMREKYGFKDVKSINSAINAVYDEFNASTRLDGLTIPAINYVGPEENIPNVFYNLNTGGVQLSKYETYAALWSSEKFKIHSEDIINVIKNKYTQLQADSDLDVDFSEDNLMEEGITLFEYCYALSGIIRDEEQGNDMLFGKNDKSTDPTGFEVLALLLTDRVNKADLLFPMLKNSNPEFLIELKEVIKNSIAFVREALKPILVGLNGSYLYSEQTYLIYHMLVSYILEYYSIDTTKQEIIEIKNSLPKRDFKKYAQYHYVYDCITDFWKTNRQVSDLQRELSHSDRREKYWHKIKQEDWKNALNTFFESQNGVAKTIPQKNKLFIDFLTKLQKSKEPTYNKYFVTSGIGEDKIVLDIEHIIPQKRIEQHIKDLTVGQQRLYPISAVGNLCYLAAKDNRAKREKTLYEFSEDRPAFTTDDQFKECVLYPEKSEISFIDYNNVDFRNSYIQFLSNRHNTLFSTFISLIDDIE